MKFGQAFPTEIEIRVRNNDRRRFSESDALRRDRSNVIRNGRQRPSFAEIRQVCGTNYFILSNIVKEDNSRS